MTVKVETDEVNFGGNWATFSLTSGHTDNINNLLTKWQLIVVRL